MLASSAQMPVYGTKPCVGFNPTTPHQAAGMRIDPPWSQPSAIWKTGIIYFTEGDALVASDATPEEETIMSDHKQVLERLLASLPEEHRTVLMLREIEEMDYAQIASVTNVPIGTVMSRLARSRAALKSKWMTEVEGMPRAVR